MIFNVTQSDIADFIFTKMQFRTGKDLMILIIVFKLQCKYEVSWVTRFIENLLITEFNYIKSTGNLAYSLSFRHKVKIKKSSGGEADRQNNFIDNNIVSRTSKWLPKFICKFILHARPNIQERLKVVFISLGIQSRSIVDFSVTTFSAPWNFTSWYK